MYIYPIAFATLDLTVTNCLTDWLSKRLSFVWFQAKLRDPDCTLSPRGFRQADLLAEYLAAQRDKCKEVKNITAKIIR